MASTSNNKRNPRKKKEKENNIHSRPRTRPHSSSPSTDSTIPFHVTPFHVNTPFASDIGDSSRLGVLIRHCLLRVIKLRYHRVIIQMLLNCRHLCHLGLGRLWFLQRLLLCSPR